MPPPVSDDVSTLCISCGLCCSGALFDRARAQPGEIDRMKALGLEVFADSKADRLRLPCAMLQGTACSIYEERFTVCRTFECRTLKAAKSGEIGFNAARDIIAEAKARLARVAEADLGFLQADARHRTFRQGP